MSKDNMDFYEQMKEFLGINILETTSTNENFDKSDSDLIQNTEVYQGHQVNQDYNTQLTLKNIWESRSMSNKDKARAINILYSSGIQ